MLPTKRNVTLPLASGGGGAGSLSLSDRVANLPAMMTDLSNTVKIWMQLNIVCNALKCLHYVIYHTTHRQISGTY